MTTPNPFDIRVLIRGGGEMASGIAHRLHRCHMQVLITEVAEPTAVRRSVAFAEAGGLRVGPRSAGCRA